MPSTLLRMPTGIPGFDTLLDGGLPRSRTTLILGGPGAGKTLFALQTLAEGVRRFREPGVMVTFEEDPRALRSHVAGFPWAPRRDMARQLRIVDGRPIRDVVSSGSFDVIGLLARLDADLRATRARRVVFDGLDVLLSLLEDEVSVRRELYRIHAWLADRAVSGLITSQVDRDGQPESRALSFLPYMADCIVQLQHELVDRISARSARVLKCRGAAHSADEMPMLITESGIQVLGRSIEAPTVRASHERVSTGVARLDAMLGGGYFRGTATLLSGSPGTAKSTLAGAFLTAACARGERSLFVSFDESGPQIVRNLASVGLKLGPFVQRGVMQMHSAPGQGSEVEVHLNRIRGLVESGAIRNVVIDPVSALDETGLHARQSVARFVHLMKGQGVSLLLTSLLDSVGSVESTATGISTIADTWIHLSYMVNAGERNRSLTVIKSRGTSHSNQVRELVLSNKGLDLADVYTAGGQVLMGTMRWEREQEEREIAARGAIDAEGRRVDAQQAVAEARRVLDQARQGLADREAALRASDATRTAVTDASAKGVRARAALRRADPPMPRNTKGG